MKRPEWAAAGTFAEAWRAAVAHAEGNEYEFVRDGATRVLRGLEQAHVISIDRDQVAALPSFDRYEHAARALSEMELPFDPLYLSLDRAPLVRFEDPPPQLLGVLISRTLLDKDLDGLPQGAVVVAPVLQIEGQHVGLGDQFSFPTSRTDGDTTIDAFGVHSWLAEHQEEFTPQEVEDGKTIAADAAELATAVLYFLDSANVELAEAPATRQERRAVERRGGRIALTVTIRPPRNQPTPPAGEQAPTAWSHRWEVRGHYKHYRAGTRLADSDPTNVKPCPRCGDCRRIWCPPHVKGPTDRPLVPKIRVIEDQRQEAG